MSDKKKNVIFELMKLIDSGLDCSQVEHRLEPFSLGRECAYPAGRLQVERASINGHWPHLKMNIQNTATTLNIKQYTNHHTINPGKLHNAQKELLDQANDFQEI